MTRTYEPIWEEIKKKKTVKVKCSNDQRARIKKAVIKEKYMDTKFTERTTGIYRLTITLGNGFVLFRLAHAPRFIPLSEI